MSLIGLGPTSSRLAGKAQRWHAIPTIAVIGLGLALATAGAAAATERVPVAPAWRGMPIGAYVWDGLPTARGPNDRPVARAIDQLTENGVRAVRLTINRQQMATMGIATQRCEPQPRVDCFLKDDTFREVLADPRLTVIGLTIHETALSWAHSQSTVMMARHAQAARAELRTFLEGLLPFLEANPGEGVFIIGNWEGDNILYCGSAWDFTRKPEFRRECMGDLTQGRAARLDDRRDALISWFRARQEEIDRFRAEHNLGGRLLHAVEFNTVGAMVDFEKTMGLDFPQALFDIIPRIRPDLCSYSAYSSFAPGRDFRRDLRVIREQCGEAGIILGELGFSAGRSGAQPDLGPRYKTAFDTAREEGVRGIFLWQAFASESRPHEYGLFRADGTPQQWRYLHQLVR